MINKLEAAQRLINVVCGTPYGNGITVTGVGVGYAEPGYHDDETVWVLGDWNQKRHYDNGQWIVDSDVPPRLFDALERIGVQGEWHDEWGQCSHCQRIFRISGDSYMWKSFYTDLPNGDPLCGDCAIDPEFIEDVLEPFINNPRNRVAFCDASVLESQGWERYNTTPYQSGLHPGMDADPRQVFAEIKEQKPGYDVIFYKDEASQFYSEWSAFIRASKNCATCGRELIEAHGGSIYCSDDCENNKENGEQ